MNKSSTEILGDYILDSNFDDFPEDVIQKAKLCILDSIACAIGGYQTKIGRIVVDLAQYLGGRPESTVIGSGERVPCTLAASVNSTMSNALDFDDTYIAIPGHPGSTVIYPAIAMGESTGVRGKDFITSVILGYEVSIRIGVAIRPSTGQLDKVWGLGGWQTFGAVTSSCKLLSLNKQEILSAFGIAGASAPLPSSLKTVRNPKGTTMVKNNFGRASEVGVMAALLSQRGFLGPLDILDGETGFWRMFGSDRCDFERMTKGLGKEYEIRNVAFKPYPVCRWIHSAIEAALHLKNQYDIETAAVKKITVKTLSILSKPPYNAFAPSDMSSAQFSAPYSIAVALQGIRIGPDWFREETLKNHEILELARKVTLVEDPEADAEIERRIIATVEIMTDKDTYCHHVSCAKGEPENPMDEDELREKFTQLSHPILGNEKTDKVINKVKKIEYLDDIRKLTMLLQ